VTRDILIVEMWAGQFACEGANWLLKRIIKQERPIDAVGSGYGFPSSHSQYMGYFSAFLICHLTFRHRFDTFGHPLLDILFRLLVYSALLAWAGIVCYSRFHLTYHTIPQIAWGAGFGVFLGILNYVLCEFIPYHYPNSTLGQLKKLLLTSSLATSFRIRDGWSVWPDGGISHNWRSWRSRWEAMNTQSSDQQSPSSLSRGGKEL